MLKHRTPVSHGSANISPNRAASQKRCQGGPGLADVKSQRRLIASWALRGQALWGPRMPYALLSDVCFRAVRVPSQGHKLWGVRGSASCPMHSLCSWRDMARYGVGELIVGTWRKLANCPLQRADVLVAGRNSLIGAVLASLLGNRVACQGQFATPELATESSPAT